MRRKSFWLKSGSKCERFSEHTSILGSINMLILRIGVVIVQAIIGSSGTPWMCGTRPEAMSQVFLSRYHSF